MLASPRYADRRWAPKAAAKDMSGLDWRGLLSGLLKFFREEMREPEHARDAFATSSNSSIPTAAGVMLVDPAQHVLFVKRSNTGDHPGEWAFPGGGCHPNDSALEELCRHSGDVDYTTYRAYCDNRFNPKLNEEHTSHLWAPWGQWPAPLHPGVVQALEDADEPIGEDTTLHRSGPGGYLRQRAKMTEMLPLTTQELRDDGVPRVHAHPGPAYNGAEAADMALDLSLAEDRRELDHDGRLHVDQAPLTRVGVYPYLGREINGVMKDEPGWTMLDPARRYNLLRPAEEIQKAADTFRGLPILWQHKPASATDHPADITIGATGNDVVFEYPFLKSSLVIWPAYATEAIEDKSQHHLSAGYAYKADMKPGSADGMSWDGKMVSLIGNHIALVASGRSGPTVAIDSKVNIQWAVIDQALRSLNREVSP